MPQRPASPRGHPTHLGDAAALVTGAGSGIGRAICILLAEEGWRVALVGRRDAPLKETVQEMGVTADRAAAISADLSAPEEAARAIDRALDHFGRLDAIISNAGAVDSVPIEKTTQDLLDRMFSVNVFGPFHMIARAWPAFVRQGGGRAVNVSSLSAHDPFPGLAAYGAAKSALEGLTRAIVNEGRPHGIRAFTVAPGAVETAMLRSLVSERELPRSATADPMDVARVVVDCALGRRDGDIGREIRVER